MSHEIELLKIIKRAAAEAFEASKPMTLVFGKVISTTPLSVQIGQSLYLSEKHLILTDEVRDHVIELTREDLDLQEHIRYTAHRALLVGEEVAMLRCAGGQKYIVLCRKEATK